MRPTARTVVFPVLLAAACGTSPPARPPASNSSQAHVDADLTGFWVLRADTGDGNVTERFFDLKQRGEEITGDFYNPCTGTHYPSSIRGRLRDGKLDLVLALRAPPLLPGGAHGEPPRPLEIAYDGALEGEKIALVRRGGGAIRRTLERTSPEAAVPPRRIPLPVLHDVPQNGLARTPPMGWNSWNKFAGKVDDAGIRSMADAMVASGMQRAGYLYVNIDDTWEGRRDAAGNITSNTKFPDMKALADYVHSKGLKIGIYSSPGPKTCAGYEGSYGHEEQDAATFAAWGFDYLKYDWCSAAGIYRDEEMQAVYQKMGDALLKTGRPIVYSLCQYGLAEVWKWGVKVGGNLWRTTEDIRDAWQPVDWIGFHQSDQSSFIGPGRWNDPDMLEIGNGGMSAEEYRTHMSLWSILAAPLIAGNDLRSMSEDTKAILTNPEVIAVDQDPDGKPAQPLTEPEAAAVVLARPLHDESWAVGLFNRSGQEGPVTVEWSRIGLGAKRLRGRDLWSHKEVEILGSSYTCIVPAHGVVMLRITPGEARR